MSNNTTSISSSAILVDVSISTWTARKMDRTVTDEVNTSKRASAQASRVNKSLFPEVQSLDAILKSAAAARNWVYEHSLPWSSYGPRLVPTAQFFEFKDKINEFEEDFWKKVNTFTDEYNTLIAAQAFQLGDMFNRDEYPDVEDIKSRFSFRVSYLPVPSTGDFRLDIQAQAMDELREQYESEYAERLEAAMAEVRDLLVGGMKHIVDRLGVKEDGKPNVFRGDMVDNFVDLLSRVRQLNLTRDDAIARMAADAERVIEGVDVDDLRKDLHHRADVRKQMKDVLDAFSF